MPRNLFTMRLKFKLMTLLEKYNAFRSGEYYDLFKDERIVFEILNDIMDRYEFDDEIKEEIIQK